MTTAERPPYTRHEGPLFFAHRGGSLLAPENTLTAFDRGASLGADALELDIQETRDGKLVVIHDATVDRTTDASGPVAAFTLDELLHLDAGYRFSPDGGATFPFRGQGLTIPTLREVFARFPGMRVNIDLKGSNPERERRLWELIQEHEAQDRRLVASGDEHAPIVRFRALTRGRVATSASGDEIRNFLLCSWCGVTLWMRPAYVALQVPETWRGVRVVSPRFIAAAHRRGLDVHVWTVDERTAMERLLAWGADGVMTDRPDLLAQVMGRSPASASAE
ncbi:MAG TPA: glycerophosphodiester phosphodiesterase [Ktedonobacterales bacterium]|nr:glycerophosphodiester phosphodiesterase [Ktedonobacterales bacterium]